MPGLGRASTSSLLSFSKQDVDGRDEPGHDVESAAILIEAGTSGSPTGAWPVGALVAACRAQAAAFRRGRRVDCFDGLAAEATPTRLRLARGVALMSSSSTSSTMTIACGRLPFSALANFSA